MLLILTALCYTSDRIISLVTVEMGFAEAMGEDLANSEFTLPISGLPDTPSSPNVFENLTEVVPTIVPPVLDRLPIAAAVSAGTDLTVPSISSPLGGRESGNREALLRAGGGSARTEDSVQSGLDWLKRNQRSSGVWSLVGPYSNGGGSENEVAATSMAMLAFQGNGHTHKTGGFQKEMQRALKALLKMQDADGTFTRGLAPNHRLYSQAQATIVLCELFAMTKDPAVRGPAQKALDYAAKIQADDGEGGGGWRYFPGKDVDTSVTGWFVMALQSGRMAGLYVQDPVLEKVSLYLDHVSTSDGSQYRYRIADGLHSGPSVTMTAEALLCRQYLGWDRQDSRLQAGAALVLENPIEWNEPNVYYWYYATQMLHHLGGAEWNTWNERLRTTLPGNQTKAGRERGSWDPQNDRWASTGGRLYMTCLCICMLEVYYRHMPIYQHSQ